MKVFSAFDANPKLELVPNTGIAATTLVGSGYAPNSRISVTWDNIPVPTVPSPLITDGYGNFTGIISVLDQTNGTYTVRAVDELVNGAAATFTVNLEVPSQPQPTVPEEAALVISVMSPENRTYSIADVPLEYTINRFFYSTTYSLDEQTNVTLTGNTTLAGLADGTHQLTVYVNCTEGSMSESVRVWFTVDTTPPNITDVIQAPVNVNGTLEDGVRVNATVTDALSGVQRVALNYSDGNGAWVTNEMTKLEEDVWKWHDTIVSARNKRNIHDNSRGQGREHSHI